MAAHNLNYHIIQYLEHCEIEKNLAPSSIKMYHFYLNDFSDWAREYLGKETLEVQDIDYELIRKYRLYLNRRKTQLTHVELKKSTQKTFLVAIRAFLKYLVVEVGLDVPSPDQIILGKPEANVPKVLDEAQLKRLFEVQNLNKKSGLRDRAILETLFSTGLRVSELAALNIEDIDLESGEFTIIGKGRKPRTVYLSASAISWLKRYLSTRRDPFSPLFLRYSGKHMASDDPEGDSLRLTVRSIQRLVKKYVHRSGLHIEATPHTLRHSFATGLLKEGADLRSVQEMLGHANVSTTQIYTHVTNQQLRQAHKKFHKDINTEDNSDRGLATMPREQEDTEDLPAPSPEDSPISSLL